jgi:hypothetical protein
MIKNGTGGVYPWQLPPQGDVYRVCETNRRLCSGIFIRTLAWKTYAVSTPGYSLAVQVQIMMATWCGHVGWGGNDTHVFGLPVYPMTDSFDD